MIIHKEGRKKKKKENGQRKRKHTPLLVTCRKVRKTKTFLIPIQKTNSLRRNKYK